MNENIDLTKILKNCPKGWEFHSSIYGKVRFDRMQKNEDYPVLIMRSGDLYASVSREGKHFNSPDSECCLFPSKEQRDWSKFTAPWYKKERFDPKTLKSFDKVLVRDNDRDIWNCDLFSFMSNDRDYPYVTSSTLYKQCIPYNDDTKHLVGTEDKALEFYRYWED